MINVDLCRLIQVKVDTEYVLTLATTMCVFNVRNWNPLSERRHSYKQTVSKQRETALGRGLEFLPCNSTCTSPFLGTRVKPPWGYQAGNTKTSPETNSHTVPSYSHPFHYYLLSLVRLLAFAFTSQALLLAATPHRHCSPCPLLAITTPIHYTLQSNVMQ